MFLKIVKNDFIRKKTISIAVFVFITMAILLAASAINNIANLVRSMSDLQERAVPADIAEMHPGEGLTNPKSINSRKNSVNILRCKRRWFFRILKKAIFILVKMKRWLERYKIFHLLFKMRNLTLSSI